MDKQQEFELIEELADKLGESSYTGTWLREQLPAIKSAMGSDLEPGLCAISFSEVRRIREQAQQEANVIIERAREAAKAIKDEIRAEIRSELLDAAYAVTKIAQDAADAQYSEVRRLMGQADKIKEIWK